MNIVILDGYTLNPGDLSWGELEALGKLTVYDRTAPADVASRIGGAQLVFTNKTPITAETMDKCPNIRWIGVLATGYNIVDVEHAAKRNIPVSNIPTYGTSAVAQFAIAQLLELCHHIGEHSRSVAAGDWGTCPDWCYWNYPLIELAEKTMGIIGFGRIGQQTAAIAKALGMNILAYDSHQNPALEGTLCHYCDLDTLYAQADVISLHCPLFAQTQGMINKTSIAKMKDGVMLLNTSRGPLIVEEDLAQALNSGKVAGAACDVVSTEPILPHNPLLQAKNILITPHMAWAPKESRMRLMHIAAENLGSFLKGTPVNVVNAQQ